MKFFNNDYEKEWKTPDIVWEKCEKIENTPKGRICYKNKESWNEHATNKYVLYDFLGGITWAIFFAFTIGVVLWYMEGLNPVALAIIIILSLSTCVIFTKKERIWWGKVDDGLAKEKKDG